MCFDLEKSESPYGHFFSVLSLSTLMDILWSFGLENVSQTLASHFTVGGVQPYFTLDQDDGEKMGSQQADPSCVSLRI